MMKANRSVYIFRALTFMLMVTLVGCNKKVTISGRLMRDCFTPAANEIVSIHQETQGFQEQARTSLNGDFKITLKTKRKNQFTLYAPEIVLAGIVFDKNIDLGNVHLQPFDFKYYITLDTDSAYTENDTLFYRCQNTPWCALPGPFSSGVIDSFYHWKSASPPYIHSFDPVISLVFRNNFDPSKEQLIKVPTPFCKQEWTEVVVKI